MHYTVHPNPPDPSVSETLPVSGARHRDVPFDGLSIPVAFLHVALVGGLMFIFVLAQEGGIPFSVFTQDPLDVAKGRPYYGLLSNIGILLWCASVSVCFFADSLLKERAAGHGDRFFLASGLLTSILMLDDQFQWHEVVFPGLFGIRQRYVLLVYILAMAFYLTIFRRRLLRRFPVYLFAALGCFALSVLEDLFSFFPPNLHYLVEDGAKLFGIVNWLIYFTHVAHEEIRSCIDSRSA